ncbi:cytochrome P450 [Mycobacterium sp. 94-17]|uniref:cytochrome P450 n=1 Tax=Mycobacterium sp. 94-17 TaxID=2986147 RepID=UPI002D1E7EB6|nr:cytochrome P450 [Mycobacterium sp. 94-17]MEB4209532.1 cytochrome P450 [Mycobacterium sp. 94-17]
MPVSTSVPVQTRPDIDLTDGQFYAHLLGHPRAAYRWMRENEPIFRDRNGLVAITTYSAIMDAERQPALFSNAGGIRPDMPPLPMMIDLDDPEHFKRRKLVSAGFTKRRVLDQVGSIDELCDDLIDDIAERGECDFVDSLAGPLPMAVIGNMMGVDKADRPKFLKWTDDFLLTLSSTATPEILATAMESFAQLSEYINQMVSVRKVEATTDMVSALVYAEVDGERLSEEQVFQEILMLLVAGDETTRHTLSGGWAELLRHPDLHAQLRDDTETLIGPAIEEMLRYSSPVKNMCRHLTTDAEFYGYQFNKGDKALLMFESANFDDSVFDSPEEFLIDRSPNNHLAFGFGAHFCIGNQLARLELREMSQKLLTRLPDLRLDTDGALPLRPANFAVGIESMPVAFTPVERKR